MPGNLRSLLNSPRVWSEVERRTGDAGMGMVVLTDLVGKVGVEGSSSPSPAPFAQVLGPGALVPNVRSLVQGRESGGREDT